jgi:ABC-type multidrug transport system fused ATPase/permease subunit
LCFAQSKEEAEESCWEKYHSMTDQELQEVISERAEMQKIIRVTKRKRQESKSKVDNLRVKSKRYKRHVGDSSDSDNQGGYKTHILELISLVIFAIVLFTLAH